MKLGRHSSLGNPGFYSLHKAPHCCVFMFDLENGQHIYVAEVNLVKL
jgi:hypothetical protein